MKEITARLEIISIFIDRTEASLRGQEGVNKDAVYNIRAIKQVLKEIKQVERKIIRPE